MLAPTFDLFVSFADVSINDFLRLQSGGYGILPYISTSTRQTVICRLKNKKQIEETRRSGFQHHLFIFTLTYYLKTAVANATAVFLPRRLHHFFDKYSVAAAGVVHKDVGDGADKLAVLNYRRT